MLLDRQHMELTLQGTEGVLRASYQLAVRFGVWRLSTIGPSLYQIDAHDARMNPAWLGFRPLLLSIRTAEGSPWMEWAVDGAENVRIDDERALRIVVAGDFTFRAGG